MSLVDFLLLASVIVSAPHISKFDAGWLAAVLWVSGGLLAILQWVMK